MTDREKLVELIFKSLCRHIHKSCKLAENIADDLIADGVTVQEWISVKDRLPEKGRMLVTDGKQIIISNGAWLYQNLSGQIRTPGNWGQGMDVRYWMPLPQPPAEGE